MGIRGAQEAFGAERRDKESRKGRPEKAAFFVSLDSWGAPSAKPRTRLGSASIKAPICAENAERSESLSL